jgi:hypothetical protein
MAQAPPLECAECDIPATVLIVHPALYQMVVPACGRHGELYADLEALPVDSPEASDFTVLRGFYVPLMGG